MFFVVFALTAGLISVTCLALLSLSGTPFSVPVAATIVVATIIAMLIAPRLQSLADRFTSNRERGTVKWFNISKGYGFITRSDGSDVFVHFRSVQGKNRRGLSEGQTVEFVLTEGEKGPQAEEVRIL